MSQANQQYCLNQAHPKAPHLVNEKCDIFEKLKKIKFFYYLMNYIIVFIEIYFFKYNSENTAE